MGSWTILAKLLLKAIHAGWSSRSSSTHLLWTREGGHIIVFLLIRLRVFRVFICFIIMVINVSDRFVKPYNV